jgi:hypothetical protein
MEFPMSSEEKRKTNLREGYNPPPKDLKRPDKPTPAPPKPKNG